jgi:hypothetical protein
MNFDFTPQLPATFDLLHIALAAITVILFIGFLVKPSRPKPIERTVEIKPATASVPAAVEQKKAKPTIKESSPESALQFLSALQQEARLIDFVQEDIGAYSDEEVGAAARVVHEGSKKAINDFFTLSPIRSEEEETRVTLEEGFNASEVRLTGNVIGSAPFSGILVHRGWRATEVKLPKLSSGHDTRIVAAAEVEL